MMERYKNLRNEAYSLTSGSEVKFSENELIEMQEKWVETLADGLGSAAGNLSESTASTMRKIQ